MHEFQSLGTELGCEKADPCGIAARPIEPRHEPVLDRVAAGPEDNWNNGGRRLGRLSRRWAEREHYCHRMTRQIGRQRWQSIIIAVSPAVLDSYVSALGVAFLIQALPQSGHERRERVGGLSTEKSDHRRRGLLRARRE